MRAWPVTRQEIRWRVMAWMEALLFLGLLFLAAFTKPVWLGVSILLGGLLASAGAWYLLLRVAHCGAVMKGLVARKVPKAK